MFFLTYRIIPEKELPLNPDHSYKPMSFLFIFFLIMVLHLMSTYFNSISLVQKVNSREIQYK